MLRIENEFFIASIAAKGAELKSLALKEGAQELIWPGKNIWERSSPVLFPFVGKSRNAEVSLNGKTYPMPQHGFARDMDFTPGEQNTSSCEFVLKNNPQGHEFYPFSFELRIAYALDRKALTINYTVLNTDSSLLPFQLGTHPAFILPSKQNRDYRLEFEKEEKLKRENLEDGLLSGDSEDFHLEGRIVKLREDSFKNDAWVFINPASKHIKIKGPGLHNGLRIGWNNFPFLGIWSKYPAQEFICIEPWHGLADYKLPSRQREGVIFLEPGKEFRASLDISIEKS